MRHLPALEWLAAASPLAIVVLDTLLMKFLGVSVVPYSIFGSKGYLLSAFLGILALALVMAEISPSALGSDARTNIELGWTTLSLPGVNTTDRLRHKYFEKKKAGESVRRILIFVTLEIPAMFLFGTLVALLIYLGYLRALTTN